MKTILRSFWLALALAICHATPTHAQIDPCAKLIDAEESESWFASAIESLFETEPAMLSEMPISDTKYWVTTTPGRFVNVSCNSTEFEWQEMFPIGVVVKPLGVIDLPKFEQRHGRPILVLTEYGHRKVVSLDLIDPLEQDLVYLFPDHYEPAKICRKVDGCAGHAPEACVNCPYEISPYYGFGTVHAANETFQAAREAYRHVKPTDNLLPVPEVSPELLQEYKAQVCDVFPVRAILPGGQPHQQEPSAFTFCSYREAGGAEFDAPGTIKIVDLDYAQSRFENMLTGSFHRRFGDDDFAEVLQERVMLQTYVQKGCGEKLEDIQVAGGGISFSAGIDLRKIVEIGADVERTAKTIRTATVGPTEYLLISTYFVEPPLFSQGADQQEEALPLKMFRIVFKAGCEGTTVVKPISIQVHYDESEWPSGHAALMATNDGQLLRKYVADNSPSGLSPVNNTNFLESGWFWQINDHTAYYLWRDALRRFLVDEVPEISDMLVGYEPAEKVLMRDFFVHLLLSAAYYHKQPTP